MTLVNTRIARLRNALELSPGGQVFIVLEELGSSGKLLPESTVLDGALLLRTSSVSEAFDKLEADGLTEILFGTDPLSAEELGWFNQQREQLRRDQTVVLRLPVEQTARFARFAPDVWRWALVLDLTGEKESRRLGKPRPATARLEEYPYAPAMDPTDVVETPSYDLTDPGLDDV